MKKTGHPFPSDNTLHIGGPECFPRQHPHPADRGGARPRNGYNRPTFTNPRDRFMSQPLPDFLEPFINNEGEIVAYNCRHCANLTDVYTWSGGYSGDNKFSLRYFLSEHGPGRCAPYTITPTNGTYELRWGFYRLGKFRTRDEARNAENDHRGVVHDWLRDYDLFRE